jgi:hypothetical protein
MRSRNLTHSIRRNWPIVLASSAAITATSTEAADWTKHFRVGMQVTLNIEADISSGGFFEFDTRPGEYDDGYVRPDATRNPNQTTNFRFETDDQNDAQARTLTFHRADSFSTGFSESSRDDSPYVGLELAYGTAITRWGDALIGWEAGYSFLPISIKDRRNLSGLVERGSYIYTYPSTVTLPEPPYTGPTSGGGSAPVINRDVTQGDSEFFPGVARGSRGLDVSLHTLRLGPTIHLELSRRWAVQGGVGPMVGYVTGEYTFNEELALEGESGSRRAEGDFGGDDFVYGGYAQALLLFHFEEHGDIYAGLQFMSLSGTEFEEGDRRAELDMGATLSFLIGVNWPF